MIKDGSMTWISLPYLDFSKEKAESWSFEFHEKFPKPTNPFNSFFTSPNCVFVWFDVQQFVFSSAGSLSDGISLWKSFLSNGTIHQKSACHNIYDPFLLLGAPWKIIKLNSVDLNAQPAQKRTTCIDILPCSEMLKMWKNSTASESQLAAQAANLNKISCDCFERKTR